MTTRDERSVDAVGPGRQASPICRQLALRSPRGHHGRPVGRRPLPGAPHPCAAAGLAIRLSARPPCPMGANFGPVSRIYIGEAVVRRAGVLTPGWHLPDSGGVVRQVKDVSGADAPPPLGGVRCKVTIGLLTVKMRPVFRISVSEGCVPSGAAPPGAQVTGWSYPLCPGVRSGLFVRRYRSTP